MRISSFNMQKAKEFSSSHNLRQIKPKYLIDYECTNNEYFKLDFDRSLYLEYAKGVTKLKTNRTMQKKQIECFFQEAVINLEKHHSIEKIKNLFKELEKRFNIYFYIIEIAIHRDEGIFIDTNYDPENIKYDHNSNEWFTKDNVLIPFIKVYSPNKNIFFNIDNKKWYKDKEFNKEFVEFSKLKKYYNYHAHIIFTRWNETTGKMTRLQSNDMKRIQDVTAEILGMERGVSKKNKRKQHIQLKDYAYAVNRAKERFRKLIDDYKKKNAQEVENLKIEVKNLEEKLNNQDYLFRKNFQKNILEAEKRNKEKIFEIQKSLCDLFNLDIEQNLSIDTLLKNIHKIENKKDINTKINKKIEFSTEIEDFDNDNLWISR